MSLSLRAASPADLPAVVLLMNAAFRGVGPAAGWNSEADLIDGNRTTETDLRQELADKPHTLLLIAHSTPDDSSTDNCLLGCVSLEPASAHVWYLGSLTIAPHLQNTGLGRQLLAAAEHTARQQQARLLRMKVVNLRDSLIAWYERRGYRRTGETSPFPYGDTRFGTPRRDDLCFVLLEKDLATAAPTG